MLLATSKFMQDKKSLGKVKTWVYYCIAVQEFPGCFIT
jgi:hypothetical protein